MNLYLAPLQGMTFAHYRNIYKELFGGIDVYYAPFIATSSMRKINPVIFKDIEPQVNKNIEVVPQILSSNGVDFAYYADRIVDKGYNEINWNIGCPYPTVTKKKKGSGILIYPDLVRSVLDEVCKDLNYDLTVKMRLGLNHLEEGQEILEILNEYPLKGVIIHARTGKQKYEGTVDLDAFDTMYKASKHEVTYNGDIYTVDDYIKIQNKFPEIKNFMMGRGILRDPFLAAEIKGHKFEAKDKIKLIKALHDGVFNHYKAVLSGDKHLCDKMKEFWMYLYVHLDPSGKLLKKIRKSHTEVAYLKIVDQLFDTSNIWRG